MPVPSEPRRRWFRNPFRSSPISAHPERSRGTEDWRAGDMAECISDGRWLNPLTFAAVSGPRAGEVRRVALVDLQDIPLLAENTFLGFDRWSPRKFAARNFRKIVPRADALERAEPAFIEQMSPVPSEVA